MANCPACGEGLVEAGSFVTIAGKKCPAGAAVKARAILPTGILFPFLFREMRLLWA